MPSIRLAGEFRKIGTGTKSRSSTLYITSWTSWPIGSDLNRTFGRTFRTKFEKYCQYWLVRFSSCLIGLLTATGKQVHLGPLHRRPIQWHLTNIWRVPESLEIVIPMARSLHPHLQWWLQEDNVLAGQSLHPSKTSANVNRCIKRRVGRSLK